MIQKMKLSIACLAACATAESHMEWFVREWWNEAVTVFNFANGGHWAQFKGAVDSVPESEFTPMWNYCNKNGDGELSGAELTACAAAAAAWTEMSDASQNFLYDFGVKYFDVIDQDSTGSLSYDEYKYTIAGMAATDARVVMKAFDADQNGKLSSSELAAWKTMIEGSFAEWGWNPTAAQKACMTNAWMNADIDGDASSAVMIEVARFNLSTYNCLF